MTGQLRRRTHACILFGVTVLSVFAAQMMPQGESRGPGYVSRSHGWPVRSWSREVVGGKQPVSVEYVVWTVSGLLIDTLLSIWLIGIAFCWVRSPRAENRFLQISVGKLFAITTASAMVTVMWKHDRWVYRLLTDQFNGKQFFSIQLPMAIKLPLYFAVGFCLLISARWLFSLLSREQAKPMVTS